MSYPPSKKLTKKEQAWIDELQAVLDRCPSDRLGFYTISDPVIHLYDRTRADEIGTIEDDLVRILNHNGWGFDGDLKFPADVEGVCG